MPLYDYENAKGERVELERTIAERDCAPEGFRRVLSTPASSRRAPMSNLFTGQAGDPGEAVRAVPRAFKELEESMPADRIARAAGFSVKTIKRAWFEDQGGE